ncbi:hypothetical protein GNZ12_29395 [Paraburkholderia sp. 1N]|uniref:Uncharacterized protein n=1 Tax=Paraburkholderia solitsugae TaxID=2675748 RepID=A0ABX2BWX6_9BURK|nr:hypothetical protein [Paraburkholderia solitsugae]NPT45362.1 hypothetical protein [Paraburkholderia solitsugae]
MAIENWTVFEALRAALLQEPGVRPDAKVLHRLHYSPAVGEGFPVDLDARVAHAVPYRPLRAP